MRQAGSISRLLHNIPAGDERALSDLHRRIWPWMVKNARSRLKDARLRSVDEEDVAQIAFAEFFNSVRAGRVPRLDSRHDLFALLTHIIACKAATQLQEQLGVQKRGGGKVRGESALDIGRDGSFFAGIQAVAGPQRTPADEAELSDLYRHFMANLPDELRPFAEMDVAGASNQEIAVAMDCAERTVERKLALTRKKWQELAAAWIN